MCLLLDTTKRPLGCSIVSISMRAIHPTLKKLSYVYILSISAILSFLLCQTVHRSLKSTSTRLTNPQGKRSVAVGDAICLPQTNGNSSTVLVLIMSTKCPYSRAMLPLAQKMANYAEDNGIETVVIGDADMEAVWPHLLRSRSVTKLFATATQIGYSSIPVIALLDEGRRVRAHKIGYDSGDNDEEIIRAIFLTDSEYSKEVSDVAVDSSSSSGVVSSGMQVVKLTYHVSADVLTRKNMAESRTSMTVDDLALRAPYEIDRLQPVVLDCSDVTGRDCEISTRTLQSLSFTVHHTLNGWVGKTLKSECTESAAHP